MVEAAPVLDAPMPAMEGQISFNLEDAGATGSLDGIPGGNLGGRVEAASFLPQFVGSWASDAFTNDCFTPMGSVPFPESWFLRAATRAA